MKSIFISLVFFFGLLSAQKPIFSDSLKLRGAEDFFVDDYRNVYLYKSRDFSFTKYDSLGKQLGQMMMTVPFRVQSVQNPLSIFLFSENAQELKLLDANLNEIQKIDFRQKFGFVKAAYAEDLQQIWILDESQKRLVQYNFRDDKIINSYPFFIGFEKILDMIVFENKLYLLSENDFKVYDFRANQLYETAVTDGRKLRRENEEIYIIAKNTVSKFQFSKGFQEVFSAKSAKIVDKNSASYFELTPANLYLYDPEK